MSNVIIYGAYGYTGKLIVEEALALGLKPTIAGRNKEATEKLARDKDLPFIVLSIDDKAALNNALNTHDIVIHCAGPFIHTAKQMAEACITTNTHYLDITGEFQVFEMLKGMDALAQKENIMLLPGAGFDVVPSDCLAAHLKSKLPDAKKLTLSFTGLGGGLSRGTAKTMIENSHVGQYYRENKLLKVRQGGKSVKKINYGSFEQISVGISWGDISTAFHSTSIPDIEVFIGSNEKQIKQMKFMGKLSFLLKLGFVKSFLKKQIDKKPAGPSDSKREKGSMHLWGKAENESSSVEAWLSTPNGYTLTAKTAMLITKKILEGDFKAGFQTPSSAYGKDLILEIEDTKRSE